MRARAMVGLSIALALFAAGCLRTKFDLCAQDPPDPQCAYLDAGADAPVSDAGADASLDGTSTD